MKHSLSLEVIQNQQKRNSRLQIIRTYSTMQQQQIVDQQYETDKYDKQFLNDANQLFIKQDTNKNIWTYQQQIKLFKLHDQMGNKWGIIAQHIQNQTDNSVKNHFYSKLRKSLRKLNKIVNTNFKKELKQIKIIVLYKIIQATQEKHKSNPLYNPQIYDISSDLKNRLLYYSYDQNQENNYQKNPNKAHQLIFDMINFSKQYRRKSKNNKKNSSIIDQQKDLLSPQYINKLKIKKRSNSQYQQSQEGTPSDSSIFGSQLSSVNSQNHKKYINNKNQQSQYIITRRRTKSKQQSQIKKIIQEQQQIHNKKDIIKSISKSMQIQQQQQQNNIKNNLDFENLLKQSGILQQEYLPPLPQIMKKISSYQQSNQIQNIIDQKQENFQFFQQSQMHMRILPAKNQDHFDDPMLNQRNFDFFK